MRLDIVNQTICLFIDWSYEIWKEQESFDRGE